jgi:hypothetical protein
MEFSCIFMFLLLTVPKTRFLSLYNLRFLSCLAGLTHKRGEARRRNNFSRLVVALNWKLTIFPFFPLLKSNKKLVLAGVAQKDSLVNMKTQSRRSFCFVDEIYGFRLFIAAVSEAVLAVSRYKSTENK